MAAKGKAPAKAAKKPVAKTATKAKAKPKGLQLSTAQWKAYNKAYAATAKAAALSAAAQRFRKYRLQSAYATIKQYNAATSKAQTAAIAAFAARQSWDQAKLAKQNAALNSRIEVNAYNHATIAGRLQFIQGGIHGYSNAAIARTVDTNQAVSYEKRVFAAAARAAKAAKKSVSKKGKVSATSKAIAKQAAAAGLKAAEATPHGAKKKRAKVKKAKAKSAKVRKPTPGASKGKSAKAPVKKAKSRTAPYLGIMRSFTFDGNGYWHHGNNEFAGTCIMTAVANAMHHQTKWRLPDADIAYWTGRAGKRPTIEKVLLMLWTQQPWPEVKLLQPIPLVPCYEVFCERIIGFENEHGDHAAFAFGAKMVSYGELLDVAESVEECWTCEFVERE